jgi:hypothetical protein
MTTTTERLSTVEQQLATATTHRNVLHETQASVTRELEAIGRPTGGNNTRWWSASKSRWLKSRRACISLHPNRGYALPVMSTLVGKPGLLATEQTVAKLTAERDELRAHAARWPSPDTTHSYRYTGKLGDHRMFVEATGEHKDVAPGDVVQLNERQAFTWRDRFEAVDEPVPTFRVTADGAVQPLPVTSHRDGEGSSPPPAA